MVRVALAAFSFLFCLPPAQSHWIPVADYELVLDDLILREGVYTDIHLDVYVNEAFPCRIRGRTALAIHGFSHSAATWEAFAEVLFGRSGRLPYCRIAAIDLPGHGDSPAPHGIIFGDLSLQDYLTALLAVLKRLPNKDLRPGVLIGHSQGGLLIQMLQQRLLMEGEGLRDYGIRKALLLAPVPSNEVSWNLVDSGAHLAILSSFTREDPEWGTIVDIPGLAWPTVFFSNLAGEISQMTPPQELLSSWVGYEPIVAALELTGMDPFPSRPQVHTGVFEQRSFCDRVHLKIVGFEQDTLVRPEEAQGVYTHLTGLPPNKDVIVISGLDAVHDLYIADPVSIVQTLPWWW